MNSDSRRARAAAGGYVPPGLEGLELGCGLDRIAGFELLLALDADAGEELAEPNDEHRAPRRGGDHGPAGEQPGDVRALGILAGVRAP